MDALTNAVTDAAELQVSLRYGESARSDDDVLLLALDVYNPTEEPIRFLPWNTPLEEY